MAKKKVRYTVSDGMLVLTLEPAEGGYVVTAPLNPDVLTQAYSVEEAFENAQDVIALFKEDRAAERLASQTVKKAPPRRKKQKVS